VHRSILTALKEKDGQPESLLNHAGLKILEDTGMHISGTERRAAEAEREVVSKYIAQIMHEHLGEVFEARITSVQSFGFFVTAMPYYVDGLVHIKTLDPRDYFVHDPKRHLLRGERSKKTYSLGDPVKVKLTQADTMTGKLSFQIEEENLSPMTSSISRALSAKKKKKLK
jgi:ribonuclease R